MSDPEADRPQYSDGSPVPMTIDESTRQWSRGMNQQTGAKGAEPAEGLPTVTTIVPNTGAKAGGTAVVINGDNLGGSTGVTFGGVAATVPVVVSETQMNCTTPASPGLAPPVQSALATAGTGGTLAAGTYLYVVAAINANGETLRSNEMSITTTGATSTVTVSWAAVAGATGYRVYRTAVAGTYNTPALVGTTTSAVTLTDTGAALQAGAPVATNGTQLGARDVVVLNPAGNRTVVGGYTYT